MRAEKAIRHRRGAEDGEPEEGDGNREMAWGNEKCIFTQMEVWLCNARLPISVSPAMELLLLFEGWCDFLPP